MRTVSYAQGCSKHYTGKIGIVLCSQQSWNKLCLTGEPSKIMFPKIFKCYGENVHDLDKERNKSRYKATNVVCVYVCVCVCVCVCVYIYKCTGVPWRRAWQPIPVFLPGESHGQRSLSGYSPWGGKESDTTEVTEHTQQFLLSEIILLLICVVT